MRVINPVQELGQIQQDTVIAIGVFDGVHRGHQEILRQTVREARSLNLTPIVLTFDIHPSELFAPAKSPTYIASLSQRMELIEAHVFGVVPGGVRR